MEKMLQSRGSFKTNVLRYVIYSCEYCLGMTNANRCQNRELQIMRIVRHPNIVELKAFYYSNGERVSLLDYCNCVESTLTTFFEIEG